MLGKVTHIKQLQLTVDSCKFFLKKNLVLTGTTSNGITSTPKHHAKIKKKLIIQSQERAWADGREDI